MQAEHYTALAQANQDIRRFRHDFRNIQLGVEALIAEGKTEEAREMLARSHDTLYYTGDELLQYDTGNGIVDALLADKQRRAAAHNTRLVFEGAVTATGISATSLCVLFGNTLDNAIEACEKIDRETEKTIRIVCRYNAGFLFLCIRNPVNEPIPIKNNTIVTTKSDKTLHGFGLYSLDKIVKEHDGELRLSCDGTEFRADISLCLKRE